MDAITPHFESLEFNKNQQNWLKQESEFHKHIDSILNKAELSEQWKESVIAPIYKGHKTDCSE
jgi:hypothetical protein